jgi:hypothetical protein
MKNSFPVAKISLDSFKAYIDFRKFEFCTIRFGMTPKHDFFMFQYR